MWAPDVEVLGQQIGRSRFFVIGGPCVIENEAMAFTVADFLRDTCRRLKIPFVFKSSYDKANRTSIHSFRGPGLIQGLETLRRIREQLQVPVLTDVHSVDEVKAAAEVVDILQIPAFLARQTDLLVEAGRTGRPVNLKKAQFLAPWDMVEAARKVAHTGNRKVFITERGTQFGYNNLVVDMRSIPIMSEAGFPVVYDATHSVQLPGGQGSCSGGQRRFVGHLACAAVAAGAHGVFIEAHQDPDSALCDGPNSLRMSDVPHLLEKLNRLYGVVHGDC
ncbi:MAG: 3-deoxy-8-phosphooctulonate synthase [Syntrophobacteraceae bacterium]|nr:3-deoxy-8-phosphooctulonate synthase [Syntrophobacteraceae bacterium]